MAISNIAHDIRTPLTIASGYTQQLLKDESQESQQLIKIADSLGMVSKRLEALMEYRRLMEGAIRANVQPTDISQLVTQQLFTYYDAFQKAQIDLQIELRHPVLQKFQMVSDRFPGLSAHLTRHLPSLHFPHTEQNV